MKKNFFYSLIFFLLLAASASSIKAQDSAALEFKNILDQYHKAAKDGNVDKMLSLFSAEVQKQFRELIIAKEDSEKVVLMGRAQKPESYEIEHLALSGNNKATLFILAEFSAMPEINREKGPTELTITFVKENNEWKMDVITDLGDPAKITHPEDLSYNPDDFDLEREGNVGGRILKTEFIQDHTLVLLRIMDEEDAVFLPKKEELIKSGIRIEDLVPYNLYSFSIHPHKTDKLKYIATGGEPIKEEE